MFVAVDGQPQVHLLPETTGLPLIEHDLRGREDASVELARLSKEEARALFDLAQGPLIRGRLVQLAEDDHMLLLTQHHVVSDGWSTGVLSHELSSCTAPSSKGGPNPLPPLTIQYPDCAAWQRAVAERGAVGAADWVLARSADGRAGAAGVADGPAATGAAGL